MHCWNKRTIEGEYEITKNYRFENGLKGADKELRFVETFHKIARDGIPFMDIASSENMGFAPYILKLNPKTPCLITDIDAHAMKRLRSRVDENLAEYDISIASFDNLEMPLADSSIDCVTSFGAVIHSSTNRSWCRDDETDPEIKTFDDFIGFSRRKVIYEVYRVLKPGGLFITSEDEWNWEYDPQSIKNYFSKHEKLYGLYTHDEVRRRLAQIEQQKAKYGLCNKMFTAAGFEVELEKIYSEKYSFENVALSVSLTGDPVSVNECDRDEDMITIYNQALLYILRKSE